MKDYRWPNSHRIDERTRVEVSYGPIGGPYVHLVMPCNVGGRLLARHRRRRHR